MAGERTGDGAEPADRPPMTRREARAREQARSAEQTRRGHEQQVLSRRRATEQALTEQALTEQTEQTGVIRPVQRTEPPQPPTPLPQQSLPQPPLPQAPAPEPTPRGMREPKPRPPSRPAATAALVVSALALLGWSATAFLDSAWPGVHLLAAVSPLVTLLALPVIAFSTGRKNLVSGVLAGIAAVLPWILAAGYAAAGPGPTIAAGGARSIRLMYVDAAAGTARAQSVTAVARQQGVDVVVMTGLSGPLSHDLAVAGLNRLLTPRWASIPQTGTDGIAVWSREGTATLELVPGTEHPTGQGLLTTPAGTVELVVAQPPGTVVAAGADWDRELRLLAGLPARSRDRVLVGDLNATPWHREFRAFTGDTWHDAADVIGRGLRPTWPSWSPLPITPTDHVLLSAGLGASAADTVRVAGTPHRAVIATIVTPGTTAPATTPAVTATATSRGP